LYRAIAKPNPPPTQLIHHLEAALVLDNKSPYITVPSKTAPPNDNSLKADTIKNDTADTKRREQGNVPFECRCPDAKQTQRLTEASFQVPPSCWGRRSYGDMGVEQIHSDFWQLTVLNQSIR